MTRIPEARQVLESILRENPPPTIIRARIRYALSMMTRQPMERKAPSKPRPITAAIRAEIIRLARTTDLSQQQIADRLGLGSGGRVCEVLQEEAKKARQAKKIRRKR